MTDSITEQKIEKKDEDLTALLVKSQVQTSESIATLTKAVDEIKTSIKKLEDKNPVTHGGTLEAKPKSTDEKDVGDEVKATNAYGQSRQASIINEGNPQSDTDEASLSMEEHKKSTPAEVKKEEVKEEEEEKPEEKKEMEKSHSGFKYIEVDAVRPAIFAKMSTQPVTGYSLLKAIETGFGGQFKDAESSMIHAYSLVQNGDFGLGVPGEL